MPKKTRLNKRTITNSQSSRQSHALRKQYLNHIVPNDEYDNFFDTSLTPYYGKVDKKGNVIYPSESRLISLYKNANSSADTIYALDFVADAFTDLQNHFNKAYQAGILAQGSTATQTIEPIKGWESVHTLYAGHIEKIYSSLVSAYFESPTERNGLENARPDSFRQYLKSIKNLYKTKGDKFPLTRSSYISSNRCPMHISGLVIEIAPSIDYSDDALKNFTYFENPNFKFYMNSLKKFGFMVDKDYPARIVADLGSPAMQEYMGKYEADIDTVFDLYYYSAKDYDHELVKVYLVQFYNNYVSSFPVSSKPCGAVHQRSQLTESDLDKDYSQDFWISIYVEFLNYELSCPLGDHQIAQTIKNAKDLNKNIDFESAMSYIGNKFNFYRYPLSTLALANISA
tara:strand:+ start:144 stop:1340 length:1197 start_codon:yes stop_codon:yes gene_type:complete